MTHLKTFCRGFARGARETPRGFFAPLISLGRLARQVLHITR